MTKKVYYNYGLVNTLEENFNLLPDDFFSGKLRKSSEEIHPFYFHAKCPAVREWHKNTWVIEMPFDLEAKFDKNNKKILLTKPERFYDFFNDDLIQYHTSNFSDGAYLELQLIYFYFFWTNDKDIWIELHHHPSLNRLGLELIPGTFPISSWLRPINFGFKVINSDHPIFIPKGTPLYYIKLLSKNSGSNVNFEIEKKDVDKDILKKYAKDSVVKFFDTQESWNLIKKREGNGQKKCPFNFLWK